MNSLPNISNEQRFMDLVAQGDPELARIYSYIKETNFNPAILPPIIRAVTNIAIGTGFGKVQIFMESGQVTFIYPEEKNRINLPVVDETK